MAAEVFGMLASVCIGGTVTAAWAAGCRCVRCQSRRINPSSAAATRAARRSGDDCRSFGVGGVPVVRPGSTWDAASGAAVSGGAGLRCRRQAASGGRADGGSVCCGSV